jgi:hypothetical protein
MTNQSIKCTRCQKLKPVDMWYLVVPTNPLVFAKEPHCFRYGYDIKWHMPQDAVAPDFDLPQEFHTRLSPQSVFPLFPQLLHNDYTIITQ